MSELLARAQTWIADVHPHARHLQRTLHWLLVLGRLKPGVTLAQANADMTAVSRQMAQLYPRSNTGWSSSVEPLKNNFLDTDLITTLWLLLGAVGFVGLVEKAR